MPVKCVSGFLILVQSCPLHYPWPAEREIRTRRCSGDEIDFSYWPPRLLLFLFLVLLVLVIGLYNEVAN